MDRNVVVACSMYGRKLNEYRPCSSSGTSHHAVPASTAATHLASSDSRAPLAAMRMNRAGSTRT